MLKFVFLLSCCLHLLFANDITDMTCTDSTRTCEAKAVTGSTVTFEKTLGAAITEFDPATPNDCAPATALCATTKGKGDMVNIQGKVTAATVDRFKFSGEGLADVYTMLGRPNPPDPTCTGVCTTPGFASLAADGAITQGPVTLPFGTSSPVPKGIDAADAEVAGVFGNDANQAKVADVQVTTTITVGGTPDSTVERLEISDGANSRTLLVVTTGTPACPAGITCTDPPYIVVTADTEISPAKEVTVPFLVTTLAVEAQDGSGAALGSQGNLVGTGASCTAADKICVNLKADGASTTFTLSGAIPNLAVAKLTFAQSAAGGALTAQMMLKRASHTACLAGLTCTTPPIIAIAANGDLTQGDVKLPTSVAAVTPAALSGDTVVDDVFGAQPGCDAAQKACAALTLVQDTVVLNGKLDAVPKEVTAKLQGQDPWKFKFISAAGHAYAAFVVVVLTVIHTML